MCLSWISFIKWLHCPNITPWIIQLNEEVVEVGTRIDVVQWRSRESLNVIELIMMGQGGVSSCSQCASERWRVLISLCSKTTHQHTHKHTHKHLHTRTHTHLHTHTCKQTEIHVHTYVITTTACTVEVYRIWSVGHHNSSRFYCPLLYIRVLIFLSNKCLDTSFQPQPTFSHLGCAGNQPWLLIPIL